MIQWLKEAIHFVRVLFIPGKSWLETEIEMVQLLAVRGEMHALAFSDHFNKDFDYDNPKPYIYVSFGLIYHIMMELEYSGVVHARMVDTDGRRRLCWRLTGRGPRKPAPDTKISFQPQTI